MSTEDKIHGDTCGGDEKIFQPGDLVSVKRPIDQQWRPDVVQDMISSNAGEKVCEWTELPLHIVDLVSQYLPVEDVFRLGSVCTQWKDITRNISRRRYGRPCFMYNTGRFTIEDETQTTTTTTTNFFDLSRPDLDLPMQVPSYFHRSMILSSKDGWVLMAEISKPKNHHLMFPFFFNPMTNVRIDLPEFEGFVQWGFSFSGEPTSRDCIVISIQHICNWADEAVVRWCRRGEDHWKERELDIDGFFVGQLTNPIFHRGSFYCVGQGGKISVFNFENDDQDNPVVWSVLPKPQVFDVGTEEYWTIDNREEIIRGTHKAYMMESEDNELLVVFVDLVDSIGVQGIRIYKMTMDSQGNGSWEEMKEIDGNFYLGNYGSMFHKGTTGGESAFHFNIFRERECISYRLRGDDYDDEEHFGRLLGRKVFPFGFWIDFDMSYPSSSKEPISW